MSRLLAATCLTATRGPLLRRGASSAATNMMVSSEPTAVGVALGQTVGVEAGEERLPGLPVKTIGKLLAQPGALPEELAMPALQAAMAKVDEMDGKDCVRILQALITAGRVHGVDEADLKSLGNKLTDRLNDISSGDMADLVDSMANASAPVLSLFARVSVAFSLRAAAATPVQLSKVAVAFSRARLSDRRLFPRLAQSAVKQVHTFGTGDLPAFLASFAAVGICHEPLLTASSRILSSRAAKMSAEDLAMVAFAYAQFYLVFPGLVSSLRWRLPQCAHELPPTRLAELVVSCSRLQVVDDGLQTIFARQLEFRGLSSPLFGQVARSTASLGISTAPRLQNLLLEECQARLMAQHQQPESDPAQQDETTATTTMPVAGEWVLDLLDCLGDSAELSRQQLGGEVPVFVRPGLLAMAPLLEELSGRLGSEHITSAYRSLRQLPASLAAADEGSPLEEVHQRLAARCATLAENGSFAAQEIISTLYSQFCVFGPLMEDGHSGAVSRSSWLGQSSEGEAFNPHLQRLHEAWTQLRKQWHTLSLHLSPGDLEDPRLARQLEILKLLFESGNPTEEDVDADAGSSSGSKPSRSRPAAIELCELLRSSGHEDVQQLKMVGPIELHAVLPDRKMAFCLLPEASYFRRSGSSAAFGEADNAESEAAPGLELCPESSAELRLLRSCGWKVVPVPFSAWRRLKAPARQEFLQEWIALQETGKR